jgi:group I intron endonuclease
MKMYNSISGIYKITNKLNGDFYIGSSTDCFRRFYQHVNKLEKNQHVNKRFQNSWNKYGKEFFQFEVVQEVQRPKGLNSKEFQRDFLFPIETEIINLYDRSNMFNATYDARGYTDHMDNDICRKKKLSTIENKRKMIYSYDYKGNLIETFKLIGKRQNLTYKEIENNLIVGDFLYTYQELTKSEIKDIFIITLSKSLNSCKFHIYDYFNLEKPKPNYKEGGWDALKKPIISYNRNGDRFEYESKRKAAIINSISVRTITDAIRNRKQNDNLTAYLCKSMVWFDDISKTFSDAQIIFNKYDEEKEKNKKSRLKRILCISNLGDEIEFESITKASIYFFAKNNKNITNVLRGSNKTFLCKDKKVWIAKYL